MQEWIESVTVLVEDGTGDVAVDGDNLKRERAAWARMVYASEAQSRWLQRDPASAEARAAVVERAAARRALMDLGVDYDALRDQERARRGEL